MSLFYYDSTWNSKKLCSKVEFVKSSCPACFCHLISVQIIHFGKLVKTLKSLSSIERFYTDRPVCFNLITVPLFSGGTCIRSLWRSLDSKPPDVGSSDHQELWSPRHVRHRRSNIQARARPVLRLQRWRTCRSTRRNKPERQKGEKRGCFWQIQQNVSLFFVSGWRSSLVHKCGKRRWNWWRNRQ